MTPAERCRHFARVAELPCMATGKRPVSLHHPIGGSMLERLGVRGTRKHSDWLVLPLHYDAHQGTDGVHRIGVKTWEAKFGAQAEMLDKLCEMMKLDLWALAAATPDKKRQKPNPKILPRNTSL